MKLTPEQEAIARKHARQYYNYEAGTNNTFLGQEDKLTAIISDAIARGLQERIRAAGDFIKDETQDNTVK